MLELLFIHNHPKNNIQINLSDELNIYISENQLFIENFKDRIPGFFGEKVSNITVFAGQNGVGKTRLICETLMLNYFTQRHYVLCFKRDKIIEVILSDSFVDLKVNNNSKYNHIKITNITRGEVIGDADYNLHSELKKIFYSNQITGYSVYSFSHNDDISTQKYFTVINENSLVEEGSNLYVKFHRDEIKRQIRFLESPYFELIKGYQQATHEIGCTLGVINSDVSGISPVYNEEIYNSKYVKELATQLIKYVESHGRIVDLKSSFFTESQLLSIFLINYSNYLPANLRLEVIKILNQINIEEDILAALKTNSQALNLSRIIDFLDFILLKLNGFSFIRFYFNNGDNIPFALGQLDFRIERNLFLKFLDLSDKALGIHRGLLRFQWPLSSGESALLSFYARLYDISLREPINKNVLLLIDEGDSFFHPEWSRLYIKNILTIVPKILNNALTIQFVFTTHSPFILSDFPAQNVKLLSREGTHLKITNPERSPFGANIHDLLAESFFLQNGLVGEFAKGKIDEIAVKLAEIIEVGDELITPIHEKEILKKQHEDFRIEEIKSKRILTTINLIGDEFVKDKLLQMYYIAIEGSNKLGLIQYYKSQIDKLQND